MYVARLIIVLFLIMAILIAYTPQAQAAIKQSWDDARSGVIELMDILYATIRNFVAGTDPHEGIDDHAPGVNFDRVITSAPGEFL